MNKPFLTSILSMLATLAIEFGIERWIFIQFNMGKPADVRATTSSAGAILGGLITCLVWILLIWVILFKSQSTLPASIIFILAGFLAFVWFPLELLSAFWIKYLFLFPTQPANFQFSGLLIATLGFVTILAPRRQPAPA